MRVLLCTICAICAALCASPALAAITWGGSYSPTSAWGSGTSGYIGYQGDGSVNVSPGSTLLSNVCYIGGSSTSYTAATGTATISGGTTAAWNNSGNLFVGYYGIGNLNASGGAQVTDSTGYIGYQSTSTGANTATIEGTSGSTSTTWTHSLSSGGTGGLFVGYYGNATMNIYNGAKVTNSGNQSNYIADQAGSTGTVNVDGTGNGGAIKSQWDTGPSNNQTLYVGYGGAGYLNITNGGVVSDNTGWLGSVAAASSGTVIVDGSGGGTASKWVNGAGGLKVNRGSLTIRNGGQVTVGGTTTSLYVGYYSTGAGGTLNVNSGGSLTSGTGLIGGASGVATVDGGTSSWTITANNGLYLGNSGNGTLNIYNGGTVTLTPPTTSSSIYVGGTSGAAGNGTLNISNGGTLNATGSPLYVGYYTGSTGAINFSAGGGTINVASLAAKGSEITGTGGVINAKGLWTDGDFTVDSTTKTISVGGATVNLNLTASSGNGPLGAGYQGNGNLTISNGVAITTNGGYFGGYFAGTSGSCTVTGPGTSWNTGTSTDFIVGNAGSSSLVIANGATLTNPRTNSYMGNANGASATMTVDGLGSTWNSAAFNNTGTSTMSLAITNGGLVATSGNNSQIGMSSGSTATVTIDGKSGSTPSTWSHQAGLAVASMGTATIKITNGGLLKTCIAGFNIDNFGYGSTGVGTVVVNGAGSSYQVAGTGYLNLGSGGSGTVIVRGGGAVSAGTVYVDAASSSTGLVSIDVGTGSSLTVGGTLTIGNGSGGTGTLRVVAGAGAAATTYTPVVAGTWTTGPGTVVYQPVGGTWNAFTHVFTASSTVPFSGAGGATIPSFDTSVQQRMLITDTSKGRELDASFLANSGTVGLTATSVSSGPTLGANQSVLDGWTFSSVTGYTAGDPVYLSLIASRYYQSLGLQYWSYDGSTWSTLAANDFTFNGTYASFTATALDGKGFAVTGVAALLGDANMDQKVDINDLSRVLTNYDHHGVTWTDGDFNGDGIVDINDLSIVLTNYDHSIGASAGGAGIHEVPEPGTLALLAAAVAGLLAFAWRKRK